MPKIYLALGANVGDRRANIERAIALLGEKISDIKVAPLYKTKPVGVTDQPDFLNTALSGTTVLSPLELLDFVKRVEREVGRVERYRWGPREIDIDILFYDDLTYHDEALEIPHPRIAERDFVLRPLADLAPELVQSILKKTLKQFSYEHDAGPFSTKEELLGDWQTGNCRRALQLYFLVSRGLFLAPEEVLCPDAYYKTGEFVFKKGQEIKFVALQAGDVIYAEGIRNKAGEPVHKSEKTFPNTDEYITSLHTAIYTNEPSREIWHATSIEGGSCYWSLEQFNRFYKPVAVKRMATK